MAGEHDRAFDAAMRGYHAGRTRVAEQHWSDLQATWSRPWAANCAALEFMQGAGLRTASSTPASTTSSSSI